MLLLLLTSALQGVAAEGRRGNQNLWLLPYAKVVKFIGSYIRKVLHEG